MKTKKSRSSLKKPSQRRILTPSNTRAITPDEALRFLEDIRTLQSALDEPTVLISLRVPGNILRALKLRAKADGKKYQSLIIQYLRDKLSMP